MVTIDNKADFGSLDKLNQILENKIDKNEFNLLVSNVATKSDKGDIDLIIATIDNVKLDADHRHLEFEKKLEFFKNDIENTKHNLNSNLNKKAENKDYDRLTSLISKKADLDYVNSSNLKIKNDINEDFVLIKNEIALQKRYIEETLMERQHKNELFYEKLSDEIYKLNDQIKNLLEERRADIEENMKFIKNVTNTSKKDIQFTIDKLNDELEHIKKGLDDIISKKIDKKELSEVKAKILSQIDNKVDLIEVQNALNTCQSDLSGRFVEYKDEMKNSIRTHENEIFNLLSKKANLADVSAALGNKADSNNLQTLLNQKINSGDFEEFKRKLEYLMLTLEDKCNQRGKLILRRSLKIDF